MDADDVMHSARLATQLDLLERRAEFCAVGCHVRLFPRDRLTPGRLAYEAWLNSIDSPEAVCAEAFVECPVAHPTLMIRSDTLRRFRYRDQGWPEDYDLVLRILQEGEAIGMVCQRLLGWRDSPQRLSRTGAAFTPERFTACKAAFLAEGFLSRSDGYVLWGYGETGKALAHALDDHDKRPTHIVERHPRRIGQCIGGAPVIPPAGLTEIPRRPVVVSVAGATARAEIRERLAQMGFEQLRDYVCAA
jgi:hypothetical protein